MCLFIKALRLVFTRIDPGVSMSISSALVHFKCPGVNKQKITLNINKGREQEQFQ